MAGAVRMDSSTTFMTTTLKTPISSPKLAVTSQAMLLGRQHTSINVNSSTTYPVPHCVLTPSECVDFLHESNAGLLLESAFVSEETIASMVTELGLENLRELPELHLECDRRGGIVLQAGAGGSIALKKNMKCSFKAHSCADKNIR